MGLARLLFAVSLLLPVGAIPALAQLPEALDQQVQAEMARAEAQGHRERLTLAVEPATGAWGSSTSQRRDSAGRVHSALQQCQHRAAGRPCRLLVQDGQRLRLGAPMEAQVTYHRRYRPDAIPFARDGLVEREGPAYAGAWMHKAMALHGNGAMAWASAKATPEAAITSALERCQGFNDGQPCFLYAVGDVVVFGRHTDIAPALP